MIQPTQGWPVAVQEGVDGETNGHEEKGPYVLYELAEFDLAELIKAVPLESLHFSQRRAVFEIGWKESGRDLELRVHLQPEVVEGGS
jgi:hypothetical protein